MKKIITTSIICLATYAATAQTTKIFDAAGNHNLGLGYSGDGGLAVAAQLSNPLAITFDAAGNQYIADAGNACVRMVNTAGIITTFAGNNALGSGYAGDGSAATAAQLSNTITALAFDGTGNLYIADAGNNRVRMVNTAGIISTFAGGGTFGPASGNPATSASFIGTITGLAFTTSHVKYSPNNEFGAAGALFITTTSGVVSYLLYVKISTGILYMDGNSATGSNMGDGGSVSSSSFNSLSGIAFDASGNLYIADAGNNRIRKVAYDSTSTNGGIISNFAGNSAGTSGFSGNGGQATAAKLNSPNALAFDASGNLYISDYGNQRIRKVNTAGIITTAAGNGTITYNGDAIVATSAALPNPNGVACDASGNLYIADAGSMEVREVTSACIPPTIFQQPALTTGSIVCAGSYPEICLNAANATGFQWQVNKGSGFNNLGTTGYYVTGCDTINGAYIPMNGWQYQNIVKGCSNVTSTSFTLNISYPTITVNHPIVCPSNSTATLTASGATSGSYTWSTTDNTDYIVETPTVTTSYTVSGTDAATTCTASAVGTITLRQAPVPSLCMVTTDATSTNNVLYWDKTTYTNVDSFVIYREVSTGTYKRIGAQLYSDSSQFTDAARSVGPANGDPNVGTYRYKLSTVDACGNESVLGPYHNTVYFVSNGSGTFTWNLYSVESASVTPVTTFNLMRDDNNTGVFHSIGSVAGNQTTLNDASYSTYAATANWRVDAQGFNCTPTLRLANGNNGTMAAKVTSHSNQNNNRTSGINKVAANTQVTVYPNPATNMLNIDFAKPTNAVSIKITSILGSEVYNSNQLSGNNLSIDISKFESGTYLVQITTDNVSEIKKMVKQ